MPNTGLRLADELTLPLDFATEGVVVIGVRGSGKSNTEVRFAELLHGSGIPFVAIDRKGDWYGIRMDGAAPGLPIPVFGGLYGDFPLEAHLGRQIADLIVDHNMSAVLDVSRMSHGARARFLVDFLKQLMDRHQVEPHVRTVIFEEAHRYIPQQVSGPAAALKEAAAAVLLEGRSFGLGCWACTQRPARLHNDVLEEVDTAILHRIGITATADLKRVRDWVKHEDLGEEIGASLTKLRAGEAWVLSPVSLGIVRRVQIDRRTTFDSGATPVVGSEGVVKRRLSTMADIDVPAIKEALAETIERAKADDPAELRKQLAERDRRIDAASSRIRLAQETLIETGYFTPEEVGDDIAPRIFELWTALRDKEPVPVEVPAIDPETLDRLDECLTGIDSARSALTDVAIEIREGLDCWKLPAGAKEGQAGNPAGSSAPSQLQVPRTPTQRPRVRGESVPPRPAGKARSGSEETRPPVPTGTDGEIRLSDSQQKILDVLAGFAAIGVAAPTRGEVAWKCLVSARSSGYEKNLGRLRGEGLVVYPEPGRIALTDQGARYAEPVSVPPGQVREAILAMVSSSQAAILRALLDAPAGAQIHREQLAELAGVVASSSGYEKNLGRLRSLGMIEYPEPGYVRLTATLRSAA